MTIKKFLSLALTGLMLLAAVGGLAETAASAEPQAAEEAAPPAPMENIFAVTPILDMYEEPYDTSVFDGKPFMLNIWASWCGPCVSEIPDLEELSQEYGDRITIVGLLGDAVSFAEDGTLELKADELEGARAFYEKNGITYPSLIPNELMMVLMYQIGMKAFPTTVFVDGDGMPLSLVEGARSKDQWAQVIEDALAKAAAPEAQ